MTWTRLSDGFAGRPEVMGLTDSAFRAHIEATIWCNEQLTDGHIPIQLLRRVVPSALDPDEVANELAKAGLWEATDTGWRVEWDDQETAEKVAERREYTRTRNVKYRERGEKHKRGDHSECTDSCPSRNPSRDASRDASRAATRPVPSRPIGKGKGQGASARSAEAPRAGAQEENLLCPHGVMNGIRLGQCPDPNCESEYDDLKACAAGNCQWDDGECDFPRHCWLRDDWPAERNANAP